jgi:hypothetical protein
MAGDHSRVHHPDTSRCDNYNNEIGEHALPQDQPGVPGLVGQCLSALLRLDRVTALAKGESGRRYTKESKS